MRRLLLFALVLSLGAALPGCAALRDLFRSAFQKPSLHFKTLKLNDVSLTGADLDTVWVLENPNPVGLSLAEVDYAFFVEGKQVVAGKPKRGLQIPASGKAELVFPTNVLFQELAPTLDVFLNKDTAKYRAEGHIGIRTPIGVLRFPLVKEGTFEVPKVPKLAFQPPKVSQVSLTQATLQVPLTLTNRNSFPLPIGGISGTVLIGGARVGQVSSGSLGLLKGRQTRTVTLPVTVNFASALSAANAIRQGRGTLTLQGKLASGKVSVPFSVSEVENFLR